MTLSLELSESEASTIELATAQLGIPLEAFARFALTAQARLALRAGCSAEIAEAARAEACYVAGERAVTPA